MKTYNAQAIREDFHRLTKLLIARGLTITTMESATSGQLASLITDTEGASAIIKGAFITYSNEAKIMQGVPGEIISTYTVYSAETAEAMAKACAGAYHADIGIGITGTMGNKDPANEDASEPGHVYFAILYCGQMFSYAIDLPPLESRLSYKLAVCKEVYDRLICLLAQDSI